MLGERWEERLGGFASLFIHIYETAGKRYTGVDGEFENLLTIQERESRQGRKVPYISVRSISLDRTHNGSHENNDVLKLEGRRNPFEEPV